MPNQSTKSHPEERYNVSPEGNEDTVNLEGIPDETAESNGMTKEKLEEAQETRNASEEEVREKELEKE